MLDSFSSACLAQAPATARFDSSRPTGLIHYSFRILLPFRAATTSAGTAWLAEHSSDRVSHCAHARVKLLHRINQLIFHVLDPHFLQPIGFINELDCNIKAGHISMRSQAQAVSFFIFLLTWRGQLDLVQNTSFRSCKQAISVSSGPLACGGCVLTEIAC